MQTNMKIKKLKVKYEYEMEMMMMNKNNNNNKSSNNYKINNKNNNHHQPRPWTGSCASAIKPTSRTLALVPEINPTTILFILLLLLFHLHIYISLFLPVCWRTLVEITNAFIPFQWWQRFISIPSVHVLSPVEYFRFLYAAIVFLLIKLSSKWRAIKICFNGYITSKKYKLRDSYDGDTPRWLTKVTCHWTPWSHDWKKVT